MDDWTERLPATHGLDSATRRTLAGARPLNVPAGATLFRAGALCAGFPFVLQGSVRVVLRSGSGREVLLYELGGGDVCIMTTACLLSAEPYAAEGRAGDPATLRLLDPPDFARLVAESPGFRHLVFAGFSARLAAMMERLDEVAFQAVAARLARRLLALAQGGIVSATQEELAVDLGSAREVVGRTLAGFVAHGWVRVGRGRVEVLDGNALTRVAVCDEVTDPRARRP